MLDDDAIERYARQIVIPGVGAAGQRKLLESTVLVVGDSRGCRQATLYLEAAGVRVTNRDATTEFDVAIVAGVRCIDDDLRSQLIALGRPLCWYDVDETGFRAGLHPAQPLPSNPPHVAPLAAEADALHDVAACDAASAVCALLLGLPTRPGLRTFEA